MSTHIEAPPATASLVSGIIDDLENLVEQQFPLMRCEIDAEARHRSAAAKMVAFGIGLFALDAIVVCMSLAHLLHWATTPPGTDPGRFPLWGCYAVVATVFVAIGGIVAQVGRVRFGSIVPYQPVEKGV